MFCSFSLGDFNGPTIKLTKLKLMNVPITSKSKSHCFSNTVIVVAHSQLKAVYTPQQAVLSLITHYVPTHYWYHEFAYTGFITAAY